jgi:hypothetical protein
MQQVTFTPDTDRAQKRVAAKVPDNVASLIRMKAARHAMPLSEAAEWFLKVGFEERVKLYKLEMENGIRTPIPPVYPRERMRQVKFKVSDSDLRRLLRLADLEFEPLGTAAGRVLMFGAEKLCGRPYDLRPDEE